MSEQLYATCSNQSLIHAAIRLRRVVKLLPTTQGLFLFVGVSMDQLKQEVHTLAVSMARLSAALEYTEKQRTEDMVLLKSAVQKIGDLTESMNQVAVLNQKIDQVTKLLANDNDRLRSLEGWQQRFEGAKLALGLIWGIVGGGISALGVFLVSAFFKSQ